MSLNPKSTSPPAIVLASASPRRKSLMEEAGYVFTIVPANIDEENYPPGLHGAELAEWLAVAKARAICNQYPDSLVLAADTVVSLGQTLLGKPADADHAWRMLRQLSGSTHQVSTGVAAVRVRDGFSRSTRVISQVQMSELSDAEIERYVATNDWQGKAGGYGIQDNDPFVTCIGGSLTNIVGLPMDETREILSQAGIQPIAKR